MCSIHQKPFVNKCGQIVYFTLHEHADLETLPRRHLACFSRKAMSGAMLMLPKICLSGWPGFRRSSQIAEYTQTVSNIQVLVLAIAWHPTLQNWLRSGFVCVSFMGTLTLMYKWETTTHGGEGPWESPKFPDEVRTGRKGHVDCGLGMEDWGPQGVKSKHDYCMLQSKAACIGPHKLAEHCRTWTSVFCKAYGTITKHHAQTCPNCLTLCLLYSDTPMSKTYKSPLQWSPKLRSAGISGDQQTSSKEFRVLA